MAKIYADTIEVLDALEEKGLEVASWTEMEVERAEGRGRGKPTKKVSAFISPNILVSALERYVRHVDKKKQDQVWKEVERLKSVATTRTRSAGPAKYGDVREVRIGWRPRNPKKPQGEKRPFLMIPLDLYLDDLELDEPVKEEGQRAAPALQSLTISYDKKQIVIKTDKANPVGDEEEDDEESDAQ